MKYYATRINENGNVAVDDSILVKDVEAAYGSKILSGFKPLFSAEAVTRIEEKGYTVSGKSRVGEFGLDLAGEFSYGAQEDNKPEGAAAALVAGSEVKAALGVDVNGAPRRAAALAKIDFLKPTYGTVSRYGIISTAASGEQIGVYASNAQDVKELMEIVSGYDEKDGTSLKQEKYEYHTDEDINGKRVCIVKELMEIADEETTKNVNAFAAKLMDKGAVVEEISCDLFETANVAWQILMSAEVCNNVSKYDGVKFGYRAENYRNIDELYVNSRTEGFNFLTKAVILYGSDVLSKTRYKDCYDKSLRIRRMAAEKFEALMKEYDAVLMPACSKTDYGKYDIYEAFDKVFEESVFTSAANLIGVPALVSCGIQLMGGHFSESLLLSMACAVEKEIG